MSEEKRDNIAKQSGYCLSCGHHMEANEAGVCPKCGGALVEKPSKDEAKELSIRVHNDRTVGTEEKNNALCFVVIGTLALIIGALFLILSLQKRRGLIVGINAGSFQFFIAMVGLIAGAAALTYGLVRLTMALRKIGRANREIQLVGGLYPKTGPKD